MQTIQITKVGRILEIGLNRPNKMNAFNWQMLEELAEAYTMLENDPELWVGLLYSTSDNFTAGLDLADVAPHIMKGQHLFENGKVDPSRIQGKSLTKPMVVAVSGYCLTIGIELFLAADICISSSNTKFGQIEVQRGIFPFGGATIRMVQRAGWGNAMRHLLTGDQFDATTALQIGLIQEIHDAPVKQARAIAQRISQQAPLGVRAILKNSRLSMIDEEAAKNELLSEAVKLMATQDAEEGLKSFVDRRKANYLGK